MVGGGWCIVTYALLFLLEHAVTEHQCFGPAFPFLLARDDWLATIWYSRIVDRPAELQLERIGVSSPIEELMIREKLLPAAAALPTMDASLASSRFNACKKKQKSKKIKRKREYHTLLLVVCSTLITLHGGST